LATLQSKSIKVVTLLKETAKIETGFRNGRKVLLGPGKQTAKTWFDLEKKKEN
jgi:hypothetical protein